MTSPPNPGPTIEITRSQDEIAARAQSAPDEFGFGWAQDVLLVRLDYANAKPFLKDGVAAELWDEWAGDVETLAEEIARYYRFALTKIENQRGISAERSVIKLREMAWLAGRDDVVTAMDAAPYPEYGAPKVAAFAAGFGLDTEGGTAAPDRSAPQTPRPDQDADHHQKDTTHP